MIWHVNRRDFSQLNFLGSDQWIWQRCCDGDFNSACARLPYCLSKHLLKPDSLDIYLNTFSESVISKIENLWVSSFLSQCSKFNLDFKNAAKNSEKNFRFWDNCIWIVIVKLSLLSTGYFSSAASAWSSFPYFLSKHPLKRDFLDIYVTTFSESVISEIQTLWAS